MSVLSIIIAISSIILIALFWLWIHPLYISSKSRQNADFDYLCKCYQEKKDKREQQAAVNVANGANLQIARGIITTEKTNSPSDNTTEICEVVEPTKPITNTTIAETSALSSNESIEDTPPMEFSDFFEWKKDGRTHTLIAKRSIFDKLGSGVSVVYSRRLLNQYPWPAPRIEGYEAGETIDEILLYESHGRETIAKFNITLTSECVVLDRCFDSVRGAELTPFNVLRLSVGNGAIMLREAQIRKEEERRERMRMEAIKRESAERDAEERAEIEAKIKEKHRKRQLEKQVEADLIERGEIFKEARRPPIPKDVQDVVYNRDGGKCVLCGSVENLHFDHIIPFSKGGATNIENLQILCQKCNLEKSNNIG